MIIIMMMMHLKVKIDKHDDDETCRMCTKIKEGTIAHSVTGCE